MELFNKFKLKFLLIPLILIGSLLLITFTTIFSITYASTKDDVNKALEAGTITPPQEPQSGKYLYIKITRSGALENVEYYHFYNYTDDEKAQIKSLLDSDSGSISFNGKYYVQSAIPQFYFQWLLANGLTQTKSPFI